MAAGGTSGDAAASSGLRLGASVRCSDGPFGELADVVVDHATGRVTHLVVEPHGRHGMARMVGLELVDDAAPGSPEVRLRRTRDEVDRLEPVEMFAFVALGDTPQPGAGWDVGIQSGFGMPIGGGMDEAAGYALAAGVEAGVTYDRLPRGGRELRRSSPVVSADGHRVGHIGGLLVGRDGEITHVVLERGHLWGRREVSIPLDAVDAIRMDEVALRLSKDEVGTLPAARVRR